MAKKKVAPKAQKKATPQQASAPKGKFGAKEATAKGVILPSGPK